jgi:hypothetical protein
MSPRIASEAGFRDAIAALGLPAGEEEVRALQPMVRDLQDQADSLLSYLAPRQGIGCVLGGSGRPDPR